MTTAIAEQRSAGCSAEIELLLNLAKPHADADREHLAALCGRVDWEKFVAAAVAHKLLPLACHALFNECPEAIPAEQRQRLRQERLMRAQRNLLWIAELGRLIPGLAEAGIDAVPFKGPILSQMAYGEPGLRDSVDMDLLVRPRDLARAARVLADLGYDLTLASIKLDDALSLRTEYHFPFKHRILPCAVELHGALVPHYFALPLDQEALRTRLIAVPLSGRSFSTLAVEDLLVFLCVHGAKHLWRDIEMTAALAGLIYRHADLDWNYVRATMQRLGGMRMLRLGLGLAERLMGIELPAWAARELAGDPVARSLAQRVVARVLTGESEGRQIAKAQFHMRARERVTDKARYLLSLLFVPNWDEIEFWPLPRRLHALYWLIRPVRVFCKSLASAFA